MSVPFDFADAEQAKRFPRHIYLRRLADDLARASPFILFQHLKCAEFGEFKKLKPFVLEKIENGDPICDSRQLQEAFGEHSSWYDTLRDGIKRSPQKTGMR